MSLNPCIVIPTYWCANRRKNGDATAVYDYITPVDKPGSLGRCLDSLQQVNGLCRVIVLVVSEPSVENQASERVRATLAQYPSMEVAMVGAAELRHIHRRMDQIGMGALATCACLTGYGAVHNLGILAASIFGHDTVIFMEDDVIVDRPDFLDAALEGIGSQTPTGALLSAKTGFFFNAEGERMAPREKRWYRRGWDTSKDFNAYMGPALKGPRFTRANSASSSCLVLHADTYSRVSFDPWIPRGEDTDYVISCRMYNRDVWLDNKLSIQRMPRERMDTAKNFQQDMLRWFYESRKVEFVKTQIDLMQVDPASLAPYPGPWLTKGISRRAFFTCINSAIGAPEHGEYLRLALGGRKEAAEYARDNCGRYFDFQRQWPALVRGLWSCTPLATQLSGARNVQSANPSFTGRFSAVQI